MNKRNTVILSAALAAALGLAACSTAGQTSAGPTTAGQGSATGGSTTPAATTSPQQTPASSGPASATPTATPTATGGSDAAAGFATFTFPDGHLSFAYPKDWKVTVAKGDAGPQPPAGVDPVMATVADETGDELLSITSGAYGGGASGPVLRTVLDAAPVPGLKDTSGEQLDFGFAFDSFADRPEFHMGIRKSREFEPSPESSGSSQVELAHGIMETHVIFGTPAFGTVDAAKAWMNTEQYAKLKRILLSLSSN